MRLLASVFLLVFFFVGPASAQKDVTPVCSNSKKCNRLETQADISQCMSGLAANADALVRAEQGKLIADMERSATDDLFPRDYVQTAVDAQGLWVSFREKTCDLESLESYGGSIQGTLFSDCSCRMSYRRLNDLRRLRRLLGPN